MDTNPNILRLLEMLDNPEAYSEQEIRDIIHKDEETLEAYRLMVAARQGYAREKCGSDVEAAWQRFCERIESEEFASARPMAQHNFQFSFLNSQFRKIAASFIGILLVSGIAFAAIHIMRSAGGDLQSPTHETWISNPRQPAVPVDTLEADTTTIEPVIYDNVTLEEMLPEITTHYGVETVFQSEDARRLRFHFVWNPQADLEKVVSDLNHFEHLHVTLKDNQLIVE